MYTSRVKEIINRENIAYEKVMYNKYIITNDVLFTSNSDTVLDKQILLFLDEPIESSKLIELEELSKKMEMFVQNNSIVIIEKVEIYDKLIEKYGALNVWKWNIYYIQNEIDFYGLVNKFLFNYSLRDISDKFDKFEQLAFEKGITDNKEYNHLRRYVMAHIRYVYLKTGVSNLETKKFISMYDNVIEERKISDKFLANSKMLFHTDRYVKNQDNEVFNPTIYPIEKFLDKTSIFAYNKRLINKKTNCEYEDFNNYRYFINQNYEKEKKLLIEDNKVRELAKVYSECLSQVCNFDIDMYNVVIEALLDFNIQYNYYVELFKKSKVKKIFVTGWYIHVPKIAAAKLLNIKVIEYQYAAVYNYTDVYISNIHLNNDYLPDEILVWDKYSFDKINLWKVKKTIIGYQPIQSVKNSIEESEYLMISQGPIQDDLVKLSEYIIKMTSYNINFKLHPFEKKFARLKNLEKKYPERFKVIDSNYVLSDAIVKSKQIIGTYSTGIYEAIYLKKRVYICKVNAYQYLEDFIERNNVLLLDKLELNEEIQRMDINYFNPEINEIRNKVNRIIKLG